MAATIRKIYLIEASEDNTYVKVTHMSAYNTTHRGVGLFNNHQNGYIFFNERESPIVNLLDVVDKTELTWESNDISEQGINILVPEGTEWSLKIE